MKICFINKNKDQFFMHQKKKTIGKGSSNYITLRDVIKFCNNWYNKYLLSLFAVNKNQLKIWKKHKPFCVIFLHMVEDKSISSGRNLWLQSVRAMVAFLKGSPQFGSYFELHSQQWRQEPIY